MIIANIVLTLSEVRVNLSDSVYSISIRLFSAVSSILEIAVSKPSNNPTSSKASLNCLRVSGLKELGMKASDIGKINFLTGNNDVATKESQFYQEQLKVALGVDVALEPVTFQIRLQRTTAKDYDMVLEGWGPDYNDPMKFLDLWLSTSGQNNSGWAKPEYDALIASAKTEIDPAKRMDILQQAEAMLMDELPIAPTFYRLRNNVVKPHVKGVVGRALS